MSEINFIFNVKMIFLFITFSLVFDYVSFKLQTLHAILDVKS